MAKKENVLSHRTLVFDSFTAPVSVFYKLLEELFAARRIPGAKVSRVLLSEGFFGAKREYVRVRRGPLVYDISAAAFGESFMVTWWLRKLPSRLWLKLLIGYFLVISLLDDIYLPLYEAVAQVLGCLFGIAFFIGFAVYMIRKIPFVGSFFWSALKWGWGALRLPTLWQSDASAAFQSIVPSLVDHAIQTLRSAQGVRALAPGELQALPPVTGR